MADFVVPFVSEPHDQQASEWRDVTAEYTTRLAGTVESIVRPASLFLDVPRLQASVGQRIRLNGPEPIVGELLSIDVDEATDTARLRIRKEPGEDD